MRITYALLKGFKRFRLSNIQQIEAQFKSPVQVIVGTNGSGKAQPLDSPIRIPNGWKRMGDVQVGETIVAKDGTSASITHIFKKGLLPVFKVVFEDGRSTKCCGDHLWSVNIKGMKSSRRAVMRTAEILDWLRHSKREFSIDLIEPEISEDIELPFSPYFMGYFIGCINQKMSMKKIPLLQSTKQSLQQLYPEVFTSEYHDIAIPIEFLSGSYKQRLQLFQGLADSGCSVLRYGQIRLSINGMVLSSHVEKLVRSLGGIALTTIREQKYANDVYVITVRHNNPATLVTDTKKKTKLAKATFGSSGVRLKIKKIIPLKQEECQCITIDHPDQLYITDDFIVTHNSTFMRELCPLPSVRTDYEQGGRKELHIEHEGHFYNLISDFTNRNSPHSFSMDGVELNIGGTTDVQTELVEQHFGITGAIRNLIYSKVTLCQTTKAERKNLFLTINPMELGLILDTHKNALSRVRECKSNLQLLYSRKADLEGKLLPPDVLHQHIQTKERLNAQLLAVDKIIYGLEQHISTLKDRFRADLEYKQQCSENNAQLVPTDNILLNCRKIMQQVEAFYTVQRGDAFSQEREKLRLQQSNLLLQRDEITRTIKNLSDEINEYHKHLDNATDRPVSAIEKEIQDIDLELAKFSNLPKNPIPMHLIDRYLSLLDKIREVLFVFRDAETKMIDPSELTHKFEEVQKLDQELRYLKNEVARLHSLIEEQEKELNQNKLNAGIPSNCVSATCGLKAIFTRRTTSVEEQCNKNKTTFASLEKELEEKQKKFDELTAFLKPFKENDLLSRYRFLLNVLTEGYFNIVNWEEILLEAIQSQPMKIVVDLEEYISGSKLCQEYNLLLEKKKNLTTEIDVLTKSSGASLEFLHTKLKEKELAVQNHLKKLTALEKDAQSVDMQYNLYLEYAVALDTIKEFQTIYTRGERALLVSKAIQYWTDLGKYFVSAKMSISEELRKLESLVRDQEVLRNTYNNETVSLIKGIETDKMLYEKIEMALSPTTGLPHRSMVRYLNALINNVNYFLSQIWSYKMRILPLENDQPLDYNFRIEKGFNDISNDISGLSDGQYEVVNLAWVLTILLQLKMLNKTPFFADEIGRTFDPVHRMQILTFLGQLIDNKIIEQLFIANHFALFTDGFHESDIICLNPENIPELPKTVNEHVRFL